MTIHNSFAAFTLGEVSCRENHKYGFIFLEIFLNKKLKEDAIYPIIFCPRHLNICNIGE